MPMLLQKTLDRGFDLSENSGFNQVHVRCSQCEALVINGVPCHETGCSNATGECRGCGATVKKGIRYCDECS